MFKAGVAGNRSSPARPAARFRWALLFAVLAGLPFGGRFLFGRPAFDPDRVAHAEMRMWKAYYTDERTEIGLQLIALLRGQYGLPFLEAKDIGERLAGAAMKFRKARGDYEAVVLPDLVLLPQVKAMAEWHIALPDSLTATVAKAAEDARVANHIEAIAIAQNATAGRAEIRNVANNVACHSANLPGDHDDSRANRDRRPDCSQAPA